MKTEYIVLIVTVSFVLAAVIITLISKKTKIKRNTRGDAGERMVSEVIGKTKIGKQYVINDYIIKDGSKSNQIDHILINKRGVFVIETKNFAGFIFGRESDYNWTQVINQNRKRTFYNPIKQNETHAKRIRKILPRKAKIIPVVVFTGENNLRVKSKKVINVGKLHRFVTRWRGLRLSPAKMKKYYDIIVEHRSNMTLPQHIRNIRRYTHKDEETAED